MNRKEGERIARVVAPHFVAGVFYRDGVVHDAAPILRYVIGWSTSRLMEYARRRRWDVRQVRTRVTPGTSGRP